MGNVGIYYATGASVISAGAVGIASGIGAVMIIGAVAYIEIYLPWWVRRKETEARKRTCQTAFQHLKRLLSRASSPRGPRR